MNRNVTPSFWKQAGAEGKARQHRAAGPAASSLLLQGVGEDMLTDVLGDLAELLGSTAGVYDQQGECIHNLLLSDWCRFLDEMGRRTAPAAACGRADGCCAASWAEAVQACLSGGKPVDCACRGGIRIYCAPISAGGQTVGVAGFGYGDPPRDDARLRAVAESYGVTVADLRRRAEAYESRPTFIVSVAKNRLLTLARLLGSAVERWQTEEVLRQSEEELRRHRAHLEELVEARTAELRDANDRLRTEVLERRKAERLKDEFVSVVSHELRTPLAITREGIALLRDGIPGALTEKQAKVLATLESNVDRLARIINDLLDISKIEAGRMSLIKERLNLSALLRQAASALEPLARQKGIALLTDTPAAPVEVYGDADRLMQVLTNLIDNAIKFTNCGQVSVAVRDGENGVCCEVADTGVGIAEADLPRLFHKFVQIGRKPGAGHKGTGLGLVIAKNIVELHRGSITVASEPNRGTTFRFTLPRYSEEEVLLNQVADRLAAARQKQGNLTLFLIRVELPAGAGGDETWLRRLAVESNGLVRGSDFAASRGPGEVLVLADIEPALVPAVRERWQRQIARDFAQLAGVTGVQTRIGHASFPTDGSTAEQLLAKAEKAFANAAQNE